MKFDSDRLLCYSLRLMVVPVFYKKSYQVYFSQILQVYLKNAKLDCYFFSQVILFTLHSAYSESERRAAGHRRGLPEFEGPQIRETPTDYRRFSAIFDGFSPKWRTKLLPLPVFSSDSNSSWSTLSKTTYISIWYVG